MGRREAMIYRLLSHRVPDFCILVLWLLELVFKDDCSIFVDDGTVVGVVANPAS